jgi:homoserine dehydrogenase
VHGTSRALNFGQKEKQIIPMGDVESGYFMRLIAADQSGVLAAVSKVFADNNVSIRSVQQKDSTDGNAEIVIFFHKVKESAMQKAVKELKEIPFVKEVCSLIRVGL